MPSLVHKRFRDYGFTPGFLHTGKKNTIADVAGISVGHVTKVDGDDIRTGVTVINPGVNDLFRKKVPAAIAVGNGFGKLAGFTQVEELGTLETPIGLTNTLAVGRVMRGIVDYVIATTQDIKPYETINAVVGETNDGMVNAIHKDVITSQDVADALAGASSDFAMGCVGAGTGTRAFAWKGGIGSASRQVELDGKTYTLGVLVQTNYGGILTIMGVPVGALLGKSDFPELTPSTPDGSCMIVLATDAPLSSRQLKRVARRALLGMVKTGSVMAHGSGDYAVAFSTSRAGLEASREVTLRDDELNLFFLAAVESVEESVYDALFLAETTIGRDGTVLEALPKEEVVAILKGRGV